MEQDGLAALASQLRDTPPEGLGQLAERDLHHLADAIRAARTRQAAALDAAGESAFRYVPRLLRGPIRRVLRA